MIDFDGPYSRMPVHIPKGKPQRGEVIGCAVCGKTRVTLLAREGERFCKKCYAGLMALRALEKTTVENTRFTEQDITHAMERMGISDVSGRAEALRVIREYDRGVGDIDDLLDEWENAPAI